MPLLSKSRAKLESLGISSIYPQLALAELVMNTNLAGMSWEFPPRAASAILQRSIDYRPTDANLVRDAGREAPRKGVPRP
jgi:hypothetical protein